MKLTLKQRWILHNAHNIIYDYIDVSEKLNMVYGYKSMYSVNSEYSRMTMTRTKTFTINEFTMSEKRQMGRTHEILSGDIVIYQDGLTHNLPVTMLIKLCDTLIELKREIKITKTHMTQMKTLSQIKLEEERKILEERFR